MVKQKLLALYVNKSEGIDGVKAIVFKLCAESLSKPLSIIYNKSMSSGTCPTIWKKVQITQLFKKGSKLVPGNYRPISLTSICCKVIEKIVRDTIEHHLTQNNLITTNQHGFVHNKACVTNLLEAIDFISKATASKAMKKGWKWA
jgi:hypothetical protein